MNSPRSVISISLEGHRSAIYVVEPPDYILNKIEMSRPTEFVHLTGVYFEGAEFEYHVRASDIREVVLLSEERFQFQLKEFMADREARAIDQQMRINAAAASAATARAFTDEYPDEEEEDGRGN